MKEEFPDYGLVAIFGCPGKKSLLRRKYLGTIAGQYSKMVYLVAEDPGYEPVEDISKEIAQYVEAQKCPYKMIEDRGEAIKEQSRRQKVRPFFWLQVKELRPDRSMAVNIWTVLQM